MLGAERHMSLAFFSVPDNLLGCDSADFDGTNDFMTRGAGLTNAADSKSGIFSCWVRIDGGDGAIRRIWGSSASAGGAIDFFRIALLAANTFQVVGDNSVGTAILVQESDTAYLAGTTWRHLLLSWDLATAAVHLYVNDVEDAGAGPTLTNDTIDYTSGDSSVGGNPDGNAKLDGCLAELYFAPGQYLDFSLVANRRKFISANGKPVSLGSDGSFPTGTAPIAYFHLNDGQAVANFASNKGSGGDFSITGTLTTGTTSPSG